MKREKIAYPVVATIVGAILLYLIMRYLVEPLTADYQPTGDQVRDFFGSAWNWLNSPEAGLWLFIAVCGLVLYGAWRNMRESRWVGLAVCVALGIGGGLFYRFSNGYPAGAEPYMDPAAWFVACGLVLWILLGIIVPSVYRVITDRLAARRFDRDWRWILWEREGVELDREGRPAIRRCNVDAHRPMQGREICTHELDLARKRSNRARRRMEGEFPQEFKHLGSPDYDPSVKRSKLEPVLSRAELAKLEAKKYDFLGALRHVAANPDSTPAPRRLASGESPAAIEGDQGTKGDAEPRQVEPAGEN